MKRALAALLLTMALTVMLSAQAAPGQLAFEAATVKPHGADPGGELRYGRICRGVDSKTFRFAINSSRKMRLYPDDLKSRSLVALICLRITFPGLLSDSIRGGPAWVDSDSGTFQAKAEDSEMRRKNQLRQMLRTLPCRRILNFSFTWSPKRFLVLHCWLRKADRRSLRTKATPNSAKVLAPAERSS